MNDVAGSDSLHRLAAVATPLPIAAPERRSKLRRCDAVAVRQHLPRSCVRALAALLVAALAHACVPLAVRRMIDFGFSRAVGLIDAISRDDRGRGVLAGASALRFYLVTTLASAWSPTCARRCSAT